MPALALAVAWTLWSFAAMPLPAHCQAGKKSFCLSWGSSWLPLGPTQTPGSCPWEGGSPLLRKPPPRDPQPCPESLGPSHPAVGRAPPSPWLPPSAFRGFHWGFLPNQLRVPRATVHGGVVQRSGHSPHPSTSHPWAPTCIPRPLLPRLTHTPVGTLTPPGPPGPPGSQAPCRICQAPPGALGSLPEAWREDEAFRDRHVPAQSLPGEGRLVPIPRLPAVTASGRGAHSKPTPGSP